MFKFGDKVRLKIGTLDYVVVSSHIDDRNHILIQDTRGKRTFVGEDLLIQNDPLVDAINELLEFDLFDIAYHDGGHNTSREFDIAKAKVISLLNHNK